MESNLCHFVAFLCNRSLSPQTVFAYLSACRFFHISSGRSDPSLASFTKLTYVLRGMKRSSPRAKRVRLPITPEILGAIWDKWSVSPVSFNKTMLWAAFCLEFFAFLRAGEFTCLSWASFNESVMLGVAVDSHSDPSYLSVRLKRSKCDPFAAGITLYVGRSYGKLCAVSAVLAYLAIRPRAPGPFFIFQDGSVLSRHRLVSELSTALQLIGLDPAPHSFRIGAASAAARAGLSDSFIQTLGSAEICRLPILYQDFKRTDLCRSPSSSSLTHSLSCTAPPFFAFLSISLIIMFCYWYCVVVTYESLYLLCLIVLFQIILIYWFGECCSRIWAGSLTHTPPNSVFYPYTSAWPEQHVPSVVASLNAHTGSHGG